MQLQVMMKKEIMIRHTFRILLNTDRLVEFTTSQNFEIKEYYNAIPVGSLYAHISDGKLSRLCTICLPHDSVRIIRPDEITRI